jgi:predicted dehydrogenase
MKQLLGVGLIGYGGYGQCLAREVGTTHMGRVAKVWSRSKAKIDLANSRGFKATQDVDAVINDPDVDCVIVASANFQHKEHCLKVCDAKKHLWAEKPLVLNLPDYDEVMAAVNAAGIVNHCNYSMRYGGLQAKLIELVDSGVFGHIFTVKVHQFRGSGTWAAGARHHAVAEPEVSGGWHMHHNCHSVDMMIRLAKSRVKDVFCRFTKSTPEAPSEESILASAVFETGCIASATDQLCAYDDLHIDVIGSKASAFFREKGNTLELFEGCKASSGQTFKNVGYFDDAMRAFLGACHGEDTPITPIAEGRHVLEVLLAMQESQKKNAVVEL